MQGVGFRPFVYRLAGDLDLAGWVINDTRGVFVEVEGPQERLEAFRGRLVAEKPPRSEIHSVGGRLAGSGRVRGFRDPPQRPGRARRPSWCCPTSPPATTAWPRCSTPPTGATAIPSPTAPTAVPGSRSSRPSRTTGPTPPCASSRCARHAVAEYEDPRDRRFHAQPNACPVCGPHLSLVDARGTLLAERDDALHRAAAAVRGGPHPGAQGPGRVPPGGRRPQPRGGGAPAGAQGPRREAPGADVRRRRLGPAGLLRGVRRRRPICSPPQSRPSCCCRARRRCRHRRSGGTRQPLPGSDAALHAPAPPAPAPTGLPGGGHQRQPERRADLHRRDRGAGAPRRHRRRVPDPRPAHRPPRRRLGRAASWPGDAQPIRRARGYAPLPVLLDGRGADPAGGGRPPQEHRRPQRGGARSS